MTHIFSEPYILNNKPEVIKNKILNILFIISAIGLIPISSIAYLRSSLGIGNLILLIGDIVLFFVILFLLFSKKISYTTKSHILLISALLISISSFYVSGIYAGGKYIFVIISVLSAIYLSNKWSIFYTSIIVISYAIITYLYINGYHTNILSKESFANSWVSWVNEGIVLLFVMICCMIIIEILLNGYKKEVINLRTSEQILFQTIEKMPVSALIINDKQQILYGNTQFTERSGLKSYVGQKISKIIEQIYDDPKDIDANVYKFVKKVEEVFQSGEHPPMTEFKYFDKKGNPRWSEIHYNLTTPNMLIVMFVDITDKKLKQREVIEAMVNAEENEKSRMAKELHDGIGPLISTAKIYAHSIKGIDDKDKQQEHAKRLIELLDETLHEVRSISNNISPHILRNYGLKDAIQSFIDKIQPVTSILFHVDINEKIKFSNTFEYTIYRTIVEMVNNSLKHANAKNIYIIFKNFESSIEFIYKDDGVGFNLSEAKGKGFGLLNMESRMLTLGAEYNFHTAPGEGVNVTINIPCNDAKNCIS
ncbi:sensor histidine kinase [Plebeiibacterium sediminum]|uniref:histidine kinase n=1 Tax=Plebeiibacterium sediminum TaxID=2992112 RepID=A0AAE3SEA6_9BACT|nr:histidine kinase [Plebeiobacterium sediminum]MCW3786016.1 histidine kinase [Plebeiobacterium sediminum]